MEKRYADFYKEKFFEILKEDNTRMEVKINVIQETLVVIQKSVSGLPTMVNDIKELNGKVNSLESTRSKLYAIAGFISFCVSVAGLWIKDKILK